MWSTRTTDTHRATLDRYYRREHRARVIAPLGNSRKIHSADYHPHSTTTGAGRINMFLTLRVLSHSLRVRMRRGRRRGGRDNGKPIAAAAVSECPVTREPAGIGRTDERTAAHEKSSKRPRARCAVNTQSAVAWSGRCQRWRRPSVAGYAAPTS